MDIWMSNEQRTQCPLCPSRCGTRDEFQSNQQWECPDLTNKPDQESLIDFLGNPGPEEKLNDEQGVGWDGEEIRFEGAETVGFELKSQVCSCWIVWNQP